MPMLQRRIVNRNGKARQRNRRETAWTRTCECACESFRARTQELRDHPTRLELSGWFLVHVAVLFSFCDGRWVYSSIGEVRSICIFLGRSVAVRIEARDACCHIILARYRKEISMDRNVLAPVHFTYSTTRRSECHKSPKENEFTRSVVLVQMYALVRDCQRLSCFSLCVSFFPLLIAIPLFFLFIVTVAVFHVEYSFQK